VSGPTKAAILTLAAKAGADPRTAEKFLRRHPVRRGLLLERLEEAARLLDMVPQPRDEETPQPDAGKVER
jgi:hypothetical protein